MRSDMQRVGEGSGSKIIEYYLRGIEEELG